MIKRAHWVKDAENAARRLLRKLESQSWYPWDRSRIRPFLETEMDNEEAKLVIARMNYCWQRLPRGCWAPIERGK